MKRLDWGATLRRILPSDGSTRPFVCAGFPDKQHLVVVGENPGRALRASWWDYWSDETGFDRAQFMASYCEAKPVIRGTRQRFEALAAAGIRVLETNTFANEKLEGAGNKSIPNFAFLEMAFRLGLPVLVHGTKAKKALEGEGLWPDQAEAIGHFSRVAVDDVVRTCSRMVLK